MGLVWRARDEVLAREVAVKEVLAPAWMEAGELARLYRRLEREAWAAARVSHRGVVTVYDVASEDGRPWIVMELVRGLSLAEVLEAEGPMPARRAAHIGEQVLAALRSAHDSGVLHRDVKPGNVLLANDGRVVLSDFGIAGLEGSPAITMTGEVVGSPEFLAPERALGQDPGPASDLWSLGVMLYTAVEGAPPFRGGSPVDVLRAVVEEELPPARRAGPLEPVLEGLLRKDPAARLSAADAARMLRVVGAGGAVRAPGGPVSGPDSPTAVAHHHEQGHDDRRRPLDAPPSEPGPQVVRRSGAGAVLTVGIVVLLAALALLGWLLVKDRQGAGEGRGAGPTGSASGSPGATTTPSATRSASAPASASASPSGAAGRDVLAYVDVVRSSYTGTCPPPADRAPAFTATVEVERTPVTLEYRWATRSGRGSGPGWQSVTYEAGGPRSRRLEHSELTYAADADWHDAVRLEVRGPAEVATQWVDISVTCEKETPTSGASSPGPGPSPSPTPSSTSSPAPSPAAADPAAGQAAFVKTGR
ncbi:protein kinase [Streptomyces sp. NPDC001717]|uniref:serine/threonine-protein kinase n=1 Tax=Streptomyces sp. NPDC001717 TaxID=3364604 RepID=UPI0036B8909A